MTPLHKRSLRWLATWFGCGLSPRAPGTVGTLGAVPLWLLLASGLSEMRYLIAAFTFAVFAVWVAQLYEIELSGGEHDRPELVIDEVAGYLVGMALLPVTWGWALAGFAVFRAFDVLKPFPISWVDRRIPGGVGAVADDLLAGILTNFVLQYLFQHGYGGLIGI